ncbi:MAG: hypothetical protein U0670_16420 [Anaerolineae bacterium]
MVISRARRARRSLKPAVSGLIVTAFSQSIGTEIVLNGDFAAWTNDNPNNWTVVGESGSDPMITQVAPDGTSGTGAARYYKSQTSGTMYFSQATGLVSGYWYEVLVDLSRYVSGAALINAGAQLTLVAQGPYMTITRASIASVACNSQGSAPHDFTLNTISVKRLTPNPAWTMPHADGVHTFSFTLPGSPVAGQRIELRYRQQDDQNYWAAALVRNNANTAWDFRLDSVSAGVVTNRISVTGVGTPDSLRVITAGSTHTAYTGSSGAFTQRGSPVTVAHLSTATGITVVYNSPVTPVQLSSQ